MDEGREGLTDIDRAIARALDVDPSAEFPARVRQRVAREPMRVPLWRGWRIWIPIGAAAAIMAAILVPVLSTSPTEPAASLPPRLTSRATGADTALPPPPGSPKASARTGAAEVHVPLRRVAYAAVHGAHEPEVLVPREEIEMYRRVIGRALALPGAVVLEPPADAAATRTFADITIDPIRIDLIAPPENGEGVRQ
jgi:hypothetical protein